jgi:DNA-binding response OmpR family regulator
MLVVEPDEVLTRLLLKHLEHYGFRVFMARTGEEAIQVLEQQGLPHLVIVDEKIALHTEFCKQIKQFTDLPVIMLIEQVEIPVVDTSHCASIDFLNVRPLKTLELLAHVQRMLQKFGNFTYPLDSYIEIDSRLSIRLAIKQVTINGREINLTTIENKILHILLREAGQIVTTRVLLQKLGLEPNDLNILSCYVASLRQKLEINILDPKYILNQAGIGYYFIKNF